ncbi:MAG: prolyl oligopeptidase family serine peptidase, partial [Thermodesulfobacteriota bacterium]|nr:prolyl oligopeptidase family serine peptidase [Thermodesulfobacteriota bacterium]
MSRPQIAPYGSWKSPITSDLIVSNTIGFNQIALDDEDVYWIEMRPSESGRHVVVRHTPDGRTIDITPSSFNARTRVHEYGGGSFVVEYGRVYFSNYSDQRLYLQDPGSEPKPISPDADLRFADGVIDHRRGRIICVCEDHSNAVDEVTNSLVSLDLGSGDEVKIIVSGNDFYSSPCISPDGFRLAWLSWNHPNMPWDGTELWMGELNADGSVMRFEKLAGGLDESIFQPQWSSDGMLYFVSDLTGWWNLYRWRDGRIEPVVRMDAEFGVPQWIFGMSTYAFESKRRIICSYTQKEIWQLASIDTVTGELKTIDTPFTEIGFLKAVPGRAVFVAGSPNEPGSVVQLNLATRKLEVLRRSSDVAIDPVFLSLPKSIDFPTVQRQRAYGFFYPPKNRNYAAPNGERPPLLVMTHGGPTAATSGTLNLGIQYWTSRGIAVMDVNYGGSSGYGRAYRQRLKGQWGIVDTDDCVNSARYLTKHFDVDDNRLVIRGGSAGGYTTLCTLIFYNIFKAGASYYGISDLEALTKETHKFELHYLDHLIGPYPERRDLYKKRSPIHFAERLSCPVIFFQGLEDKIVPPNQAEMMFKILREKGLPVAYVPFEKEQHGFRIAENIKRTFDAELYFYSRVFGFDLADSVK